MPSEPAASRIRRRRSAPPSINGPLQAFETLPPLQFSFRRQQLYQESQRLAALALAAAQLRGPQFAAGTAAGQDRVDPALFEAASEEQLAAPAAEAEWDARNGEEWEERG